MTKYRYRVEDCCGSFVEMITFNLDEDAIPEAWGDEALEAAGYEVECCESCGSATYTAIYVGVAEDEPN